MAQFNPWENALVWAMQNPPEGLWEKAVVLSHTRAIATDGQWEFVVEIEPGSKHSIKTYPIDKAGLEFEWIKRRDQSSNSTVNTTDMTSLAFLNEPEMIECMRLRFIAKEIYTNTGPILMAVNPFERLPVYTKEVLDQYHNASPDNRLGPHVFQLSDRAYKKMFVDKFDPDKRENQTILVNGESGAGKTESTKQVLKYLSVVSSAIASKIGLGGADVENQIVASNPITESFGNAKTSRNNNSSRFGKFIELSYAADGYIEGAIIRTYLLETVRIARQMTGERNYHIFYEIFAGLSAKQKSEWGISSLKDFYYTNQSGEYNRHDDENDTDNYERLRDAMTTLDIPVALQDEVIKVVVAVLHIGNLVFVDSAAAGEEAAGFSDKCSASVTQICSLLGVTSETLLTAVARRSITIAGAEIQKALNSEGAAFARDTFAKLIYDCLFKWMIQQVNLALSANTSGESASFIGVLDIFGFEFFAKNSFEQLCINYTNEKLQDHFNYSIFKSEQEVYKEEGLKWVFVDYPDNSARLELLEHKSTGIYALLDEQLKVPKCSDEKFAKSLYDKCGKHKFFSASKSEMVKLEFVIKHFACDVKYQAEGFLDKNRREVPKEFYECLLHSDNLLVRQLYQSNRQSQRRIANKGKSHLSQNKKLSLAASTRNTQNVIQLQRAVSVSKRYAKDLSDLMTKIRATRSNFVRCIKPNASLQPGVFNNALVMQQLRCGGVFEAIQVFRAGYPQRFTFEKFVMTFASLWYPCGKNLMVKDFLHMVERAKTTGSTQLWMCAAQLLIKIAPLAGKVLNMIDHNEPVSSLLSPDPNEVLSKEDLSTGIQFGHTMVFMRASTSNKLDHLSHRVLVLMTYRVQYLWRIYNMKKNGSTRRRSFIQHFSLVRMERYRRRSARIISAIITIQRKTRVWFAVRRKHRAIFLATKLAAIFRSYKVRVMLRWKYNHAATVIQSNYRRYRFIKLFKRLRHLAVILQRFGRRWLCNTAKKRAERKQQRAERSVVLLQAMFRGFRVRKERGRPRKNSTVMKILSCLIPFQVFYFVILLNIYFSFSGKSFMRLEFPARYVS